MFKVTMFLVAIASLAACTPKDQKGEDSPRAALQDYVSKSFAAQTTADKSVMASRLTGKARALLEAWSDEEFKAEFLDKKKTFIKLQIESVKFLSDNSANITYELVYLDHTKGKERDTKVTYRRLAELAREEGIWKIANVRSIKELIEFRDEMSLP